MRRGGRPFKKTCLLATADESPRTPDALEAALTDVVLVLSRACIPYALIGGLATGYRSRPLKRG